MVRRLVMNAVKDGKMEAMVYSFPSDLCTDSGRAINNNAPNWPETLQGKAKELYDRYEERVKPQGYRLKAMVINFPGGVPGRHRLLPELGAASGVRAVAGRLRSDDRAVAMSESTEPNFPLLAASEPVRRFAQKKACSPVWARPRIRACTSWVPS